VVQKKFHKFFRKKKSNKVNDCCFVCCEVLHQAPNYNNVKGARVRVQISKLASLTIYACSKKFGTTRTYT
jgi:hypothetical protein